MRLSEEPGIGSWWRQAVAPLAVGSSYRGSRGHYVIVPDVFVDGFHYAKRHLDSAVAQDPFQVVEQHVQPASPWPSAATSVKRNWSIQLCRYRTMAPDATPLCGFQRRSLQFLRRGNVLRETVRSFVVGSSGSERRIILQTLLTTTLASPPLAARCLPLALHDVLSTAGVGARNRFRHS